MSVLIETSLGILVVDLYVKDCPKACLNFIKLCKIKYYNNCLFFDIQKDYLAQTGNPENISRGGNSIFGIINGDNFRYFDDEIRPHLRHNKKGIISTANFGPNLNNSSFFIQLTDQNLTYINDKHTVFGKVEEGLEVLDKINNAYVDKDGRPYQNIRIKHTIILDDPFEDPPGIIIPSKSPEIIRDLEYNRLEDDFKVADYYKDQETEEKVKEKRQEHEAKNRAIVLEMLEDLPDAEVKPPENVLFVCKLNPVTQDDDLELIFNRFGPIKSCQIIRDWKTGESLQYAFIEFEKVEDCEQAYFKMNGVIIDERRIKVDFSQSVSKLWYNFKKNESLNMESEKNETILPIENQKFQMRHNKNFMVDNRDYRMLFNEEKKEHKIRKDHNDQAIDSKEGSEKKKSGYEYDRQKNKNKKKYQSRSRSRNKNRSRSRNKNKEKASSHRSDHHHYNKDKNSNSRKRK